MSNSGGNLTVQYNLRWTEEMRDKIAAAAKENTRSMNQEIVARLEESFTPSLEKETMHIAITGFCTGLHFRYQAQLEELQAELRKEVDATRIKILESEIQRMEILSTELKAITERMNQKNIL